MRNIVAFLLALIVIIQIIGCEKSITDDDDNLLKIGDPIGIDVRLIGYWDWLYTQDPRTGEITAPETEKNARYLRFTNDVKALFFRDDTLRNECTFSTVDSTFSDGTGQTFVDLCDQLIPYNISNDTLQISYAATDGPVMYYINSTDHISQ